MRYVVVRYVANDGEIRWLGMEVEEGMSDDDVEAKVWDEYGWDYGDGGIYKIIDVS